MSTKRIDTSGECPWGTRLGAFCDDELGGHEAGLVAAHVDKCARCARELGELRRLRELLSNAYSPAPAPQAVRAMAVRARTSDAGLLRAARALTACAALLLLVFSIFALGAAGHGGMSAGELDVEVAAVSLGEPGELAIEPEYEFACWIVADLSGGR